MGVLVAVTHRLPLVMVGELQWCRGIQSTGKDMVGDSRCK